ncbi:hypothetical protein K474DRAFT_972773 [Panus rudis PR-1116 ss-1]|nr:hypothetical protein K474DRAFT_972773 [Panus rudis PR-1116 ss-1]
MMAESGSCLSIQICGNSSSGPSSATTPIQLPSGVFHADTRSPSTSAPLPSISTNKPVVLSCLAQRDTMIAMDGAMMDRWVIVTQLTVTLHSSHTISAARQHSSTPSGLREISTMSTPPFNQTHLRVSVLVALIHSDEATFTSYFTTSYDSVTTLTASPSSIMSHISSTSATASLCVVLISTVLVQVFAGPVVLPSGNDHLTKELPRRCLDLPGEGCEGGPSSSTLTQFPPTPTPSNPLAITSGATNLCEQLGNCNGGPTPTPTLQLDPHFCTLFNWCTSHSTPTPTQTPRVMCGGLPCDRGPATAL